MEQEYHGERVSRRERDKLIYISGAWKCFKHGVAWLEEAAFALSRVSNKIDTDKEKLNGSMIW